MTEDEWLICNYSEQMLRHLTHHHVVEHPTGEASGGSPREVRLASDRKLRLFACACWWTAPGRDPGDVTAVEAAERWAAVRREADPSDPYPRFRQGGVAWCLGSDAAWGAREWARASDGRAPARQAQMAALLRDVMGNPFRQVTLPVACHCGTRSSWPASGECIRCAAIPWCPWLTPLVIALARAAHEERGRQCQKCRGTKKARFPDMEDEEPDADCPDCHGTGRTGEGLLDPDRLAILADALDDAGCDNAVLLDHLRRRFECRKCHKDISHLVKEKWGGCPWCGSFDPVPVQHVRGCWVLDLLLGKE